MIRSHGMSVPSSIAAADAARYVLLRRLAPAMRHHLVVPLQPIGMVCEIMARRLRAEDPNLSEVVEGVHKVSSYSRAAQASCVDVITWLAPEQGVRTTASEGLRECLALLQTSFTFRGFALRDDLGEAQGEVARSAFRYVVSGALLFLSDASPSPAHILITGEARADALVVSMRVTPSAGEPPMETAPLYRPLSWDDIDALATADGARVLRDGTGLRVELPWVLASA